MSHASIDESTRKERGLQEDIIRLCVGIEDPEDLIDDLRQALVRAGAVRVTVDGTAALSAKSGGESIDVQETRGGDEIAVNGEN
jgi:cystathionine beta-lyase